MINHRITEAYGGKIGGAPGEEVKVRLKTGRISWLEG